MSKWTVIAAGILIILSGLLWSLIGILESDRLTDIVGGLMFAICGLAVLITAASKLKWS